jgi:predicted N-formylglutamate amidohydrolase
MIKIKNLRRIQSHHAMWTPGAGAHTQFLALALSAPIFMTRFVRVVIFADALLQTRI